MQNLNLLAFFPLLVSFVVTVVATPISLIFLKDTTLLTIQKNISIRRLSIKNLFQEAAEFLCLSEYLLLL